MQLSSLDADNYTEMRYRDNDRFEIFNDIAALWVKVGPEGISGTPCVCLPRV